MTEEKPLKFKYTNYGDLQREVMTHISQKQYDDMMIRLKMDRIRKSQFLRMFIEAYLQEDARILQIIEEFRKEHGKLTRAEKKRIKEEKKELEKNIAPLDNRSVERIFDILETEMPEV